MAEVWPITLPQKLNVEGHSHSLGDPTIRSKPEVGPAKVRPRSSAVADPLSGQMYMTTEQFADLVTFYKVTVRGSDVFTFPDPDVPVATSPESVIYCRFTAPPSRSATRVPGTWSVGLAFEIVP